MQSPHKSDELQACLSQLLSLSQRLAERAPHSKQALLSDAQTLAAEAQSPTPDKKKIGVTAKGLIEAARTVGDLAVPITKAVRAVLALIGMSAAA